ncbi:MAG TPA: pyridoxal-phosphate dependent enzyme [Ardenticatenaceae bacterium]|nr:pyridoxal-phosphate dependent enzyme [Ardenticatenaceae bacterium]
MATTRPIIPGPTYAEMRDPRLLPPSVRAAAAQAADNDELDPLNLFNITWHLPDGRVNHILFPPELTGVPCNVIVLLGQHFPSGSHKVGPAYATLAEAEALDGLRPGDKIVIGPSTGNFGIGTSYVSRLKGYEAHVVMPDNMSAERYERIRKYGGNLDLTPGTESDVILTLERTYSEYVSKPERYIVLAQFELLPNYRFHRYVTGNAALEVARQHGNGRVAAFVSAPGSAGTLAAGDEIKAIHEDALIVAVEPRECPTLYSEGQGSHRIEGIGDKMVTLIHNILNTDYVTLVHDDDTVKGVKVVEEGGAILVERLGVPERSVQQLRGRFGMSGICNVIGAIKTARLLGLGKEDNVVTIATDAFDRYPSVMRDLEARVGPIRGDDLEMWAKGIFRGATTAEILDTRSGQEKERLHEMKVQLWGQFGYGEDYLDRMMTPDFWEAEYARIPGIDEAIRAVRGDLNGLV